MIRRIAPLALCVLLSGLIVTSVVSPASATSPGNVSIPFVPDCKDGPVPDTPGQGLSALFSSPPDRLPPKEDPFAERSTTTIYEQYGFAGIRFNTYDLGCGPDVARDPSAVIGTALANWLMQLPVALTALTGSLTKVAFKPDFLGVFDPAITQVSAALHDSLFAEWLPLVLALLGIAIVVRARRAALATSTAAVGWALLVILLATALFRWPVQAGHIADETVTGTLGAAVTKLDGHAESTDPGSAVSSQVESAVFYRAWLAGTLGSADSAVARKYGPDLFDAQALTWREADFIDKHPEAADALIDAKKAKWERTADAIKESSPDAYEYLTGRRSEARVGYAVMAFVGAMLALPFLLLSSLLLLGCFMIVRLAVMMFPAFATLGAFPAARGLIVGLGRTVGAAIVNSIIFGVGAGVTVMVLGLLFNPGHGTPGWLGLVLMPLFTYIMWKALRPFRRLSEMVSPHRDHFRSMAGAGDELRGTGRLIKRAAITAAGVYAGNVAASATINAATEDQANSTPHRAEADPSPPVRRALPASLSAPTANTDPQETAKEPASPPSNGFIPQPSDERVPAEPTEPQWVDGEEVYDIYRPGADEDEDAAVEADASFPARSTRL